MGVIIMPHATPSTSIGVANLPQNSETSPSHSASVDMSNVSLPAPTNTTDLMPTPASSEVVIYDPSHTHPATQMGIVDHALTPQSPSPGAIATHNPSHTHVSTQMGIVDPTHSHYDHLPLPQFPPAGDISCTQVPLAVAIDASQPSFTQRLLQNFLSDVDINMDHTGLMSIPSQYDISYQVSTLEQPTEYSSDTVISRGLLILHLLLCGTRYP